MYARSGVLVQAEEVLYELSARDVVAWSSLISGFAQQGQGDKALSCFEQMQHEGLTPNIVTLVSVLKACGSIRALKMGEKIHDEIVEQGLLRKSLVLGNALVDMYAKCGALAKAQQVVNELPVRDTFSWSALIAGFTHEEQGEEACNCFDRMQQAGLSPDAVTYACILKACGSIGAVDRGKQIHDEIVNQSLLGDYDMLGNALIDMYARCGALAKAQQVLDELPSANVVSWTSLIAGYAQQGLGKDAVSSFERMEQEGHVPNVLTFTCLLNACTRSSLLKEGELILQKMIDRYKIRPNIEHYTCMLDLFGRTGHFDKAVVVSKKMPFLNDNAAWSALLGACQKWENVKLGRWAFDQVLQVDKDDSAAYVHMASIYTAVGMHGEAESIEAMRLQNALSHNQKPYRTSSF